MRLFDPVAVTAQCCSKGPVWQCSVSLDQGLGVTLRGSCSLCQKKTWICVCVMAAVARMLYLEVSARNLLRPARISLYTELLKNSTVDAQMSDTDGCTQ